MPTQTTHDLVLDGATVTKTYVRWERGEAAREWAALTLLAEHAPGLAPVPLERGERDGAPRLVMTRLPGVALGEEALTSDQTAALGAALRRLYDVPVPDDLPERTFGPSTWRSMVRSWAQEEQAPPGPVADALAAGLDHLSGTEEPAAPSTDRVLGMADGNIGNVLHDGDTCRLVDFERAGFSDPAFEVADLLEHISTRLGRPLDEDALAEAVGLSPAQRARVASYRPDFAVFWLLMLLPGNPAHHRNPPGSLEDQARHVLGLLS